MDDLSDSEVSVPSIDGDDVPEYAQQNRANDQSDDTALGTTPVSGRRYSRPPLGINTPPVADLGHRDYAGGPPGLLATVSVPEELQTRTPRLLRSEGITETDLAESRIVRVRRFSPPGPPRKRPRSEATNSVKSPSAPSSSLSPAISKVLGAPVTSQATLKESTKKNAEQSPSLPQPAHSPSLSEILDAEVIDDVALDNWMVKNTSASKHNEEVTLTGEDLVETYRSPPPSSRTSRLLSSMELNGVQQEDEEEDEEEEDEEEDDEETEPPPPLASGKKPTASPLGPKSRPREFKWNGSQSESDESGSGESDSDESGSEDDIEADYQTAFHKPLFTQPTNQQPAPSRNRGQVKAKEMEKKAENSSEESSSTESSSEESSSDEDEEEDEEESEADANSANPDWDPISRRVLTGPHMTFKGLSMPLRAYERRFALRQEEVSDLRQYYTTFRGWGAVSKKKDEVIDAILKKEREALAD